MMNWITGGNFILSLKPKKRGRMKIEVTAIRINPDYAVIMAQQIAEVETEHHDDNYEDRVREYMADFYLIFDHETPFGTVEIDVTGVLREDYNFDAKLVSRWINDMKLYCWLDGGEIEFNRDEIADRIEKLITV